MFKRFCFYTIIIAIIVGSCYRLYQYFDSNTSIVVSGESIEYDIPVRYTSNSIDSYISSHEEAVAIVFYDSTNTNCIYLFNSIFTSIEADYGDTAFDDFIFCDLTDYLSQEDLNVTDTKNHWGFYEVPTLALLQYDTTGVINVVSILEWSNESPLSYDTIVAWLTENELLS